MLMRFEPFSEFDRITEQLKSERRAWQIPVDAYRRDDEYKVLFDLPGTDPGSIEVTVDNDVLTVRGTRTWLRFDDDQIAITERPKGEFSRQLFLAGEPRSQQDHGRLRRWRAHRHDPRDRTGEASQGQDR